MNKDQFAAQWKTIKGKVQAKFGKLTEDEIAQVNGRRDTLLSIIQKKYGYERSHAEEQLSALEYAITGSRDEALAVAAPRSAEGHAPRGGSTSGRPHNIGQNPSNPQRDMPNKNPGKPGFTPPNQPQRTQEAPRGPKNPGYGNPKEQNPNRENPNRDRDLPNQNKPGSGRPDQNDRNRNW